MRIPNSVIEDIRYRCDIEEVIGSYITLKRAGSNVKGLCPFHSEKTPSFVVYKDTQSYYCFGCGAGGDVITFTMRVENLDYRSAIELLAQRAGIQVPQQDGFIPQKKEILTRVTRDFKILKKECLSTPFLLPKTRLSTEKTQIFRAFSALGKIFEEISKKGLTFFARDGTLCVTRGRTHGRARKSHRLRGFRSLHNKIRGSRHGCNRNNGHYVSCQPEIE